ncbi:MAG: hypothetical protein ACKO4Q_16235, partial [Planctomycetota bacterium]
MQIHRVRGRDLKDALERAQRQYGADALVLSRETMPDGGVTVAVADPTRALAAAKLAPSVPPVVPARERGLDDVERVLRRSGASEGRVALTLDAVARSGARGPFALDAAAESLAHSVAIAPSPRIQRRAAGVLVQPCVIAFVGPTGVGKTTTLAKLAAEWRVSRGLRVGLVAADAFRVGAFEQLRTYARIIDSPVRAADSRASVLDALAAMAECDVVLVDTPGRAPRDAARIGEVADVLAAVRPDETHLVIPGTAAGAAQLEAARAFAAVGPTRIVLSKLDEASALGPLVAAVRASGLGASWFTTGQEVPDDI